MAWFVILIGVFFLGSSIYTILWRRNIVKNGEHVDATVIEVKRRIMLRRGSSIVFTPVLRYVVDGHVHEVEYGEQGPIPKYSKGEVVRIIYHRKNPKKITDANRGTSYLVFSLLCAVVGFIVISIGTLSIPS